MRMKLCYQAASGLPLDSRRRVRFRARSEKSHPIVGNFRGRFSGVEEPRPRDVPQSRLTRLTRHRLASVVLSTCGVVGVDWVGLDSGRCL